MIKGAVKLTDKRVSFPLRKKTMTGVVVASDIVEGEWAVIVMLDNGYSHGWVKEKDITLLNGEEKI